MLLNDDEIHFFIHDKRCRMEFDCIPFSTKIQIITEIFFYYDIRSFNTKDIKSFFKKYEIKSPITNKPINPSVKKINQTLKEMDNIISVSDDNFYINFSDTSYYKNELIFAYEKEYITK